MMDLSVIIPARNEEFLQRTIDSVLGAAQADTEVIAVLDGYWPTPGIRDDSRVTLIHNSSPIGQRAATNKGVKYSQAKYIMKLDAHCSLGDGFDKILIEDCKPDWTLVPRMHNLHAFDWVCRDCSHRTYQGPTPNSCSKCGGKNVQKEIIWKPRMNSIDYMWFDTDLKFRYFDKTALDPYGQDVNSMKKLFGHKYRDWAKGDVTPQMTSLGACWFMERERFWEIDGLDEGHGGWGQMGVEIACKSWLSGGKQMVDKRTWYAHMFRTQGGDFSFPYELSGRDVSKARRHSQNMWKGNKWPKAKHDLDWMLRKFAPLPGWKVGSRPVSKGLAYYTDNRCEERILQAVRKQIQRSSNGHKIISVSQYPVDLGRNIVVNYDRSVLSMFKQILLAIQNLDTDYIFLTEHDVVYNDTHFAFTPPRDDVYYYNNNMWMVDVKTGKAITYDQIKHVSALCASRELLLDHYTRRVEYVEKNGYPRKMGYEPGKPVRHGGLDDYKFEYFQSDKPLLDLKHSATITRGRFKLDQYRCKNRIKDSWEEAKEIPHWGVIEGNVDDLLRKLCD